LGLKKTNFTGYVLCSTWVSQIWDKFSSDLVRKSFEICGIHNEHRGILDIRINNFHSTLKHIIKSEEVVHSHIDMDLELAEANNNMSNDAVRDLFDEGSAVEETGADEDLEIDDEEMGLMKIDKGELDILVGLENDLTNSPESSQDSSLQLRIQEPLRSEVSSISLSPPDRISIEEDDTTFLTYKT
jgi:hypothetical protein